jgi:transcriptional regulator with XRE-family HTH domain
LLIVHVAIKQYVERDFVIMSVSVSRFYILLIVGYPIAMSLTATFSSNVRAEMARYGLEQQALADALGVTRAAVSAKLLGKRRIYLDELGLIADALGIEPADLLTPPRRLDLLNTQVAGNVNSRVQLDAEAPLAQLVEQQTLNLRVQGSSP